MHNTILEGCIGIAHSLILVKTQRPYNYHDTHDIILEGCISTTCSLILVESHRCTTL